MRTKTSILLLGLFATLLAACGPSDERPNTPEAKTTATSLATQNTIAHSPTSTVIPTRVNTATPTSVQVEEILAPPLPTTVPDQATRLAQACEEAEKRRGVSVDFVIDVEAFKDGHSSFCLSLGDNWYKYTSTDGGFSVLLRGTDPPNESVVDQAVTANDAIKVNVVQSEYLGPAISASAVTFFNLQTLNIGKLSAIEFLETFTFEYLESLGDVDVEIAEEINIQLNDYPGKDLLVTFSDQQSELYSRIRVYVIDHTIYQLTAVGVPDEVLGDNGERFLNSFTLNNP